MFGRKEKPYIKFRHRKDHEVLPRPIPASKGLPQWFKSLPRIPKNAKKHEAQTIKRCVPVLDSATNGFYIPAWCDIAITAGQVVNEETGKMEPVLYCNPSSALNFNAPPITTHGWQQVGDDCPISNYDFGKILLKFTNPWVIETPKGWSCLFKSPPHHYSHVRIIEGVVDTDTYHRLINFPFFWDGNEEGDFLIEAGTPLVHVIPFKRETVDLQFDTWDARKMDKDDLLHSTRLHDSYRKFWWHKRKAEE